MLRLTLGIILTAALLHREAAAFRELWRTSRDLHLELTRR